MLYKSPPIGAYFIVLDCYVKKLQVKAIEFHEIANYAAAACWCLLVLLLVVVVIWSASSFVVAYMLLRHCC